MYLQKTDILFRFHKAYNYDIGLMFPFSLYFTTYDLIVQPILTTNSFHLNFSA